MRDRARFLKLLETATHPTATDNERLNALNACRRLSDKAGGIAELFGSISESENREELILLKATLANAVMKSAELELERDALRRKLERYEGGPRARASAQAKKGGAKSPPSGRHEKPSHSKNLVHEVLTKNWQELHRIHEAAKNAGFNGTSADTKAFLDRLCEMGKAVRREPGTHPDGKGSSRWQAQSWKLKQNWTQAFRR